MGATSSKNVRLNNKESPIPEEVLYQISLIFNKNNCPKVEITQDRIKGLWKQYLTQELLEAILKAVFKNSKSYVLYQELTYFYWKVCQDSSEKEATMILELTRIIGNGDTGLNFLSKVVSEFILSYFKISCIETDSLIKQWVEFGSSETEAETLTNFLTDNLNENNVDVEAVELWMAYNNLFRFISQHVYKTLFNTLPLEEKKILVPDFIPKLGYISHLSVSDLMFLHWKIGMKSTHKWRLLFSLDNDGQSWSSFIKAILAQGPTLIVIYDTNGFVFGAFASQSWNMNPHFYGDAESFLFTLRPKINIFESTGYNNHYQYINTGQATLPNGLGMGGVQNYWGLFLKSDFGTGLVSETCTTFRNYVRLAQDKEFKIHKLQVWGVGAPDPTPQELGERSQGSKSVLDRDPAAAAILELAGRPLHSTEIRKMKPVDEENKQDRTS